MTSQGGSISDVKPARRRRRVRPIVLLLTVLTVVVLSRGLNQDQDKPPPKSVPNTLQSLMANAQPGDVVTLQPRVYETDSPVVVPKGVTLSGRGATVLVVARLDSAVVLSSNSRLNGVTVDANGFAKTIIDLEPNASGVRVDNSIVKGRGTELTGIGSFAGSSGLTISDTKINHVMNAIQISGPSTKVEIDHVTISQWSTRGIRVQGNENGSSSGLTISDSRIGPNIGKGRSRYPIFAGSTGLRHTNIVVEDSVITGRGTAYDDESVPGTADQISITKTNGVIIRGNISREGGERGINVTAANRAVIENNTVEGADTVGIGIGSSKTGRGVTNFRVVGNALTDNGRSRKQTTADPSLTGIRLTSVSGGLVSGNTISALSDGSQKYAITIDGVVDVDVRSNIMKGTFHEKVFKASKPVVGEGHE